MQTASHQLGLGCLSSLRNGPPVGFLLHQEGWCEVSLERCELCLRENVTVVWGAPWVSTVSWTPGKHEADLEPMDFLMLQSEDTSPSLVSVPSLHNGTNHSHLTEWEWTPKWCQSIHSPFTGVETLSYRRATAILLLMRFRYEWDTQSET